VKGLVSATVPQQIEACNNNVWPAPGFIFWRHSGGSVWTFADGHAKWVKQENADANACAAWKLN
jgi:prepilin-type processing-associated H-X9-DG protein